MEENEAGAGASARSTLCFSKLVGMRVVVVHGGGRAAISRAMDTAGIQPHFIQAAAATPTTPRSTSSNASLGVRNQPSASRPRDRNTAGRERGPCRAASFPARPMFCSASRITLSDGNGQAVDLGYVGRVTKVVTGRSIDNLLLVDLPRTPMPVIPSMCVAERRSKLNVNADTAATAVAQAAPGRKAGVPQRCQRGAAKLKDDPDTLHSHFAHRRSRPGELIANGRDRVGHDSCRSGSLPGKPFSGQGCSKVYIISDAVACGIR